MAQKSMCARTQSVGDIHNGYYIKAHPLTQLDICEYRFMHQVQKVGATSQPS